MTSAELLQAGRLDEALTALQGEIRDRPQDERLRIYLFQLEAVKGRLDKALNQLQVLATLDADSMLLAQIFRPVITCELLRREVFSGKRSPLVFGEPTDWMGWLIQAGVHVARGEFSAASQLREKAFEAAPSIGGKVDDTAFEWIADADSRLGPVMEAFIEGKYFWVPMARVRKVEFEKPSDLRDLVWLPVNFTWTNGGAIGAHIPVRYPSTENSGDAQLRLARRTEWQGEGEGG
ncbi:MAG TPA: virulence protein SciE type, partial [Verrucomicrobiales bacterium]|nr:virulence protein SciE type [Verrucomicrobiales bacterium]